MRKFSMSMLSVVLTMAIILTCMPLNAFAASVKFVKDLKIVYASSPEEALSKLGSEYTLVQRKYKDNDGKTVYEDCSLTDGSYGKKNNGTQKVYLAYSTTTKETEAITDISAMFMSGNFDLDTYTGILQQFDESVQDEVDSLKLLIEEYRKNYDSEEKANNTTGKAHAAYASLSIYYDEDYISDYYKGLSKKEQKLLPEYAKYMTVADIFLDETICTNEYLTKFYVQGNTSVILSIEQAVAVAQGGETSWLERFSKTSYDELFEKFRAKDVQHNSDDAVKTAIEKAYYDSLNDLYDAWYDLDKGFAEYENSGLSVLTATEEEIEEKYPESTAREEFLRYGAACEKLKKISYGDSNLYDAVFNKPASEIKEYPQVKEFFTLLSVLTSGEKASLKNGNMISFITMGLNEEEDYEKVINTINECLEAEIKITETTIFDYDKSSNEITTTSYLEATEGDEKPEEYNPGENVERLLTDVTKVDVEPISIYLGVDRDFFKSGVALTKEAVTDIITKGITPIDESVNENNFPGTLLACAFLSGCVATAAGYCTSLAYKSLSNFKSEFMLFLTQKENKVINWRNFPEVLSSKASVLSKLEKDLAAKQAQVNTLMEKNFPGKGGAQIVTNEQLKLMKKNIEKLKTKEIPAAEADLQRFQRLEKDVKNTKAASIKVGIGIGVTCVFAGLMIVSLVYAFKDSDDISERIEQRENEKYTYPVAIPERMCWAKDTVKTIDMGEGVEPETYTITDFFFYKAVKNAENDDLSNCDIYAKTQKQWVTLYTTTDWGCGYPILADSLVIRTGDGASEGYEKAVHFFGQKSNYAQNLHDCKTLKLTEKDGEKDDEGFYIYYNCYKPFGSTDTTASVFADNWPICVGVVLALAAVVSGGILIIKKKKKSQNA